MQLIKATIFAVLVGVAAWFCLSTPVRSMLAADEQRWDSSDSILPPGVVAIEYLEFTGTQFIYSGINISDSSTLAFEVDGQFFPSDISNYQPRLISNETGGGKPILDINYYVGNSRITIRPWNIIVTTSPFERKTYLYDGEVFSIYDSTGSMILSRTAAYSPVSGVNTIVIGRRNNTNQDFYKMCGRLYYAHFVTDFIEKELIPVRVGTTGFLYDLVSGSLLGNNGTGDFILGPDL